MKDATDAPVRNSLASFFTVIHLSNGSFCPTAAHAPNAAVSLAIAPDAAVSLAIALGCALAMLIGLGIFLALYLRQKKRAQQLALQLETQLRRDDYDPLTGMLSKQHFFRAARACIDENPDVSYAIVRWDLSHFKVYNDLYGTDEGDRLLRELGRVQLEQLPQSAVCARIEADHFIYCLPREAVNNPEQICRSIQEWFRRYDSGFAFVANVGIYFVTDRETPIRVMCDRALLALRSVKGNYHRHFAYYEDGMRETLIREQQTVLDMRAAIEQEQFELYFQPQYNYETGVVFGAEALVRWRHPVRGLVSPNEFIPAFEKSGFITEMDRYIWRSACRYLHDWLARGEQNVPITVSVNVSRVDIYNPALIDDITRIVEQYGVPCSMLKLEITESAYMDNPQQLIEMVKTFKRLGFTVEMDDFGSGYSSLNTLKDVPVDVLKLDLKFLSGDEHTGRGGNILSSIIRMARWLDMPVIAEGVETMEQAEYLKSIGCVLMQGYYFARPMPAAEFEAFLQSNCVGSIRTPSANSLHDFDELWNPRSPSAKIFAGFIGGAGILEYAADTLDAIRINDRCFRLFGLTREQYAQRGLQLLERIHPEDAPTLLECLHVTGETRKETQCDLRTRPSSAGGASWLHIRLQFIAKSGGSTLFFAALDDVSEVKRSELTLLGEVERYRNLMENLNVATFDYDCKNDTLTRVVHSPDLGLVEKTIPDYTKRIFKSSVVHPDSAATLVASLRQACAAPVNANIEYLARYGGGDYSWMRAHYESTPDETGQIAHVTGRIDNIQEYKDITQQAEALCTIAESDAVTGLMTRAAFAREVERYLLGKRSPEERGALIMIDVDNLKHTNDTYGHILGDKLLRDVSFAITQSFRNIDITGRIGGDEFMVLIPHVTDQSMLSNRLDQLLSNLHARTLPDGERVTCSIGAVSVRGGDKSFQPLYQLVDEALYAAKHAGKDCCSVRWES